MDKQQWIDRYTARYLSESDISRAQAIEFAEVCWEQRGSDDDSPEEAADGDISYFGEE